MTRDIVTSALAALVLLGSYVAAVLCWVLS